LALSFAKAQNIGIGDANIEFEDPTFKTILLSASPENGIAKDVNGNAVAVDTNHDGEISQAEALNIGELTIPNRYGVYRYYVYSLAGIEYFTNLTVLRGSAMRVCSLEVSALTKLKELYWSSMPTNTVYEYEAGMLYLSSLALPETPTLEVLDIYGSSVSNLDFLSRVPNLKKLYIDDVKVENINISGFQHLEELSAVERRWSTPSLRDTVTITVSDLPELTTFNCGLPHNNSPYDIPIVILSLSNLLKINILAIQAHDITINNLPNLTKLDCSTWDDPSIIEAHVESLVLNDVPKLEELHIGYCNLKTLDLSNVPNLIILDNNMYSNAWGGGYLENLDISKNTKLQSLVLSNIKGLKTLDVSHNINLAGLYVGGWDLTSLYMKNGVKKTFGRDGSYDLPRSPDDMKYRGYFINSSNLNYICCDEDDIDALKGHIEEVNSMVASWGAPPINPTITSDCGNEDLAVSNVTDNGATLSWSAVSGATSYTIEYRKLALEAAGQKNTTFAEDWTRISNITATTYTLSGLADGSVYQWRLIAAGSGNETPVSGPFFTTAIKPLGTEEISSSEKVALYPNPVKDILYFSASGKATQAEIYDLNGRLVKTAAVSNNSVNVSTLSKGVYFIILRTDKGTVKEKFIKN